MNKNSANVGDRIAAVMDRDVSGASFDELMLEVETERRAGKGQAKAERSCVR